MICGGYFDINQKEVEIEKLNKDINGINFWNDKERADKILNKQKELKNIVTKIKELKKKIHDMKEMNQLIEKEEDIEIRELIEKEVLNCDKELSELELILLLNGKYDKNNCILEVHSGAGGTEACDWAMMLYRMYTRWCEKKGYKIELLDILEGEEVGIKSAVIQITGNNAYGYLKYEKGIHRLVRLSPFDSNNKRHTSFASVEVVPQTEEKTNINIQEKDLKIDVYRSSGAGGQHVNTTDSAVRITHLPTKTVVTCQAGRSQIQNKEKAIEMLKNKLNMLELEKQEKEKDTFRAEHKNIEFGSQIRSYVMHPYSMVKDHRTDAETSNISKVLDGDIDLFIESNMRRK